MNLDKSARQPGGDMEFTPVEPIRWQRGKGPMSWLDMTLSSFLIWALVAVFVGSLLASTLSGRELDQLPRRLWESFTSKDCLDRAFLTMQLLVPVVAVLVAALRHRRRLVLSATHLRLHSPVLLGLGWTLPLKPLREAKWIIPTRMPGDVLHAIELTW